MSQTMHVFEINYVKKSIAKKCNEKKTSYYLPLGRNQLFAPTPMIAGDHRVYVVASCSICLAMSPIPRNGLLYPSTYFGHSRLLQVGDSVPILSLLFIF